MPSQLQPRLRMCGNWTPTPASFASAHPHPGETVPPHPPATTRANLLHKISIWLINSLKQTRVEGMANCPGKVYGACLSVESVVYGLYTGGKDERRKGR